MLTNFISELTLSQEKSKTEILKAEVCGKSLSGVGILLLTITDFATKTTKKTILINGRMHPGETHASWLIHGLIRFLVSPHPEAIHLRQRIIFKIVPILNVDGVIAGNYRASFSGVDLNRMFGDHVSEKLNPEACMLKQLAKE
jgi:cytosolic carboxypeptidase protein 2/3